MAIGLQHRWALGPIQDQILEILKTYETYITGNMGSAKRNTLGQLKAKVDASSASTSTPKQQRAQVEKGIKGTKAEISKAEKASNSALANMLNIGLVSMEKELRQINGKIDGIKKKTIADRKNDLTIESSEEEVWKVYLAKRRKMGQKYHECPDYILKHRETLLNLHNDIAEIRNERKDERESSEDSSPYNKHRKQRTS